MADDAFRITTVPTDELCRQLDCRQETEDLDAALADAGYVRLDHGLEPAGRVAIMASSRTVGLDPGHRGSAIALATSLFHIVHADGRPEPERLRRTAQLALDTVGTDPVGEWIIAALAAYAADRDPGLRPLDVDGPFGSAPASLARVAYEAARNRNIVTDVALERATTAGDGIPGWQSLLMGNIRVEEPIVRMRRHDAADYERHGIEPQIAELMAWIRANPEIEVDEFVRYAQFVGVEPKDAGIRIAAVLSNFPMLTHGGGK